MSDTLYIPPIEQWLNDIRLYVREKAPEILSLLEIYIGEAKFGRNLIHNDLNNIGKNAKILEVGAGSMILSCQLVKEGYDVTALEPMGSGYSHFNQMQALILDLANHQNSSPQIMHLPVEKLDVQNNFDFAFSINVMEHVEDVSLALTLIGNSLKEKAVYRFTCPNYLFPYEPHFNIPTLFSKSITEKFFKKLIFNKIKIPDPEGTWNSLNWINVHQIKKIVHSLSHFDLTFNKHYVVSIFERILHDSEFCKRRSGWMIHIIKGITHLRLHYLFGFIPIIMQPTIDCKITRLE
ncbi:bifunctional 3-demethylubiquinone-9 3-methyltransferase/ 2-octaprenyl-6-hydroxy phenol methylase [Legionella steelei]|uniref:Bifunctional 3-demethylubiquinone-9 3-methyltransferase/ 2-octaprenyl-6-hydroxy phenol methylase n=1 Tax=Legionella steelei TaxID=947033 RepID=A0A0W0ZKV4_9GAMM|nr:methyltransferase domain-containing protein [Legionella steelei]KTD69634.1 bifunctional 3-demethylubiquinone-9 3-methyltransferase/ 2-octaprenyl-6-hydroxy phenol methylase [Legionella steelei]